MSFLCILAYILLGLGIYGFVLEKWGALRATYFGVVTLTSVGFGDLTPSISGSKVFTIFYAILGISLVTLAVSQVRYLPVL